MYFICITEPPAMRIMVYVECHFPRYTSVVASRFLSPPSVFILTVEFHLTKQVDHSGKLNSSAEGILLPPPPTLRTGA